MSWKKGNSEITTSLIKIPIKVHVDDVFYYAIGWYDYEEDVWWDVTINKILNGNNIEFWDDSEEPDEVEIWTEIKKMLWEGTLHDYISSEGIEQLKSKYTITRK